MGKKHSKSKSDVTVFTGTKYFVCFLWNRTISNAESAFFFSNDFKAKIFDFRVFLLS